MLGAAWIADRAVLPAIGASRNGRLVALASRDPERARELAARHGVPRSLAAYDEVLADPDVDAVYVPLINSMHRDWAIRALQAGKHVLCEKPLARDAAEAREMAAAARQAGRHLMEAVMYRFHPRMLRLHQDAGRTLYLHAAFAFPLDAPGNYRLRPELGGGALLDVGSYGVSAARWFLGEPDRVAALADVEDVDMTVGVVLGFPQGGQASVLASFAGPEHQELVLITAKGSIRVERPFTSWKDPDDPYQLMVEGFADAVLRDTEVPLPLADSIANLEVIDRIRAAAGLSA